MGQSLTFIIIILRRWNGTTSFPSSSTLPTYVCCGPPESRFSIPITRCSCGPLDVPVVEDDVERLGVTGQHSLEGVALWKRSWRSRMGHGGQGWVTGVKNRSWRSK